MTIDTTRSGYDNLFLVGGYNWYAKFSKVNPDTVEQQAKRLAANFDKLDKKDVIMLAKWENEVLLACGKKGKPLPVVHTKAELRAEAAEAKAVAVEAAKVEAAATAKVEAKPHGKPVPPPVVIADPIKGEPIPIDPPPPQT